MREESRIEQIIKEIKNEWLFLGLSAEKLCQKILEKFEEGDNYETCSKKY